MDNHFKAPRHMMRVSLFFCAQPQLTLAYYTCYMHKIPVDRFQSTKVRPARPTHAPSAQIPQFTLNK